MKKLICKIKGHQFTTVKKAGLRLKEYRCKCCRQKYTEDGYGQIVKLTQYWETNNSLFEEHLRNRNVV